MLSEIKLYESDFHLVSYPRSGSSWLRYMLAHMLYPGREWNLQTINSFFPDIYVVGLNLASYCRPRFIKSHSAYDPRLKKVVYVYRDVRDVIVSYHNHEKTVNAYSKGLDEFVREFKRGEVMFGSWKDHVEGWLFSERTQSFLGLKYETLCSDTVSTLKLLADFIEINCSVSILKEAAEKFSFQWRKKDVKNFSAHYKKGYRGGVAGVPGAGRLLSGKQLETVWEWAGETMEKLGYYRT